jgi:biotin carboxylase
VPTNVFVIGLDRFNLETLQGLRETNRYEVHPLLDVASVRKAEAYDFEALLARADDELRAFEGEVDAIVTWWDFPSTALVPILCERWDLRGPSLRSILVLENKYWSRVAQRAVARPYVPAFGVFDPFDPQALDMLHARGVSFPFWVKPVKSVASYLGFRIDTPDDFAAAVKEIQGEIHLFGDPFQQALDRVELPPDVDATGGAACIAEGLIDGWQCTLEGYVIDGTPTVYGVVDSMRARNGSTFDSYRYPSRLPLPIQERMAQLASDVVVQAGLSEACFNAECFYEPTTGQLWVLEVNTRASQSHFDLFAKVDGASSQRVVLDVALARRPRLPYRDGPCGAAGKFFLRVRHDGVVRRVPSEDEIAAVAERFPGTRVQLAVAPGTRLSDLQVQDSYSFELGSVHLGAPDHDQLEERFAEVEAALPFEIDRT